MTVSRLSKGSKGVLICPECNGELFYLSGGQIRIVNGRVDYDNVKPKYICPRCGKFYRELLHTGYFDVFAASKEDIALAGRHSGGSKKKHKEKHIKKNRRACPRTAKKGWR